MTFLSRREASLEQRFQSNDRTMATLFVRMERRMVVLLLFSLRLESEEERKKISRTIIEKLYVWRVFVDWRIEVIWRCDERSLEEGELPVLEEHQGSNYYTRSRNTSSKLNAKKFFPALYHKLFTIAFKEINLLSVKLCRSSCRINHLLLIFCGRIRTWKPRSDRSRIFVSWIWRKMWQGNWNLIKKLKALTLTGSSKTVVGIVRLGVSIFNVSIHWNLRFRITRSDQVL